MENIIKNIMCIYSKNILKKIQQKIPQIRNEKLRGDHNLNYIVKYILTNILYNFICDFIYLMTSYSIF